MSYSFTYRSVDFATYGVTVLNPEHVRLAQPRVNVAEFSQASGGVTQGATFGLRPLTLRCMLVAASEAARVTAMNSVLAQLVKSQTIGPADLSVDMIPGKVFKNARLVAPVESSVRALAEEFILEFVTDPFPLAVADTDEEESTTDGVSTAFSIDGVGEQNALWIIKNTSGGAASSITINNDSVAGFAVWSEELPDGDWLRLNSETQVAEQSSDSGANWTSVPTPLSGKVPAVLGGEDNDVTVTGIDADVKLTYTEGGA